jgi:hypothetical protein
MLKRVEAERDDGGSALGAPDAEHPAFLAELVPISFWVEGVGGRHR